MTGLKLQKQHELCVYQATNKQTNEDKKEKERKKKRIMCWTGFNEGEKRSQNV